MSTNKLSAVYDKGYDEAYNQILERNADHIETKKVMGQIYLDTKNQIDKRTNIDDVRKLFELTKNRYAAA